MPIRVGKTLAASSTYGTPFVGPVLASVQIAVNVALLTTAEVDAKGWLKPGIPLTKAGILVTAGFVYGVTIEPIKIAEDNTGPSLTAVGTIWVGVAVIAMVNRDAAESMLGRAYTSAEAAGFDAAGSKLVLIG